MRSLKFLLSLIFCGWVKGIIWRFVRAETARGYLPVALGCGKGGIFAEYFIDFGMPLADSARTIFFTIPIHQSKQFIHKHTESIGASTTRGSGLPNRKPGVEARSADTPGPTNPSPLHQPAEAGCLTGVSTREARWGGSFPVRQPAPVGGSALCLIREIP